MNALFANRRVQQRRGREACYTGIVFDRVGPSPYTSPAHLSPRLSGVYFHASQPGLQCADLVFDEMQRIAAQCEGTELTRFPCLRDRIVEVRRGREGDDIPFLLFIET